MMLGRICGTVVSTIEHPFYDGKKQLILRACLPDGTFDGDKYVVAVDLVGAGVGELVLVEDEGNSARKLLDAAPIGPVRSVVVGIVDQVEVGESRRARQTSFESGVQPSRVHDEANGHHAGVHARAPQEPAPADFQQRTGRPGRQEGNSTKLQRRTSMTSPVNGSASRRTTSRDPELTSAESASTASAAGKEKPSTRKTGDSPRSARDAFESRPSGPAPSYHGVHLPRPSTPAPRPRSAEPSSSPSPTEALRLAGRQTARQQAAQVMELNHAVQRAARRYQNIDPVAQGVVGAAGLATTAPMLVAAAVNTARSLDISHLVHAAEEAERSVSYLAGDLGEKIGRANGHYNLFMQQASAYTDASRDYLAALDNSDHARMAESSRRMNALVAQMKQSAVVFAASADTAARACHQFDDDAETAAIHVYASALTGGAFAGLGTEEVAVGAAHFAADLVKHVAVDSAVSDGLSDIAHRE